MSHPQTTLVTFLLDRSGSMGQIWDETIGGFNVYLETLQKGCEAIKFTLLQFDSGGIDKCCVAEPVANVTRLDRSSYQPRGGTPLIDAAFKTITAVEDSLKKYDTVPKIIVCIQTDGHENQSREHTWEEVKRLITEKTEKGWQFNFMGTGIDAYDQGARMGISAQSTISSGTSKVHIEQAFCCVAESSVRFARGVSRDTAFRMSERAAAGDRFAHEHGVSRKRLRSFSNALSSITGFFNGWRSTPGTMPATSQLDKLISITGNTPSRPPSQPLDLSTPAASPSASKHSGASSILPDFSL